MHDDDDADARVEPEVHPEPPLHSQPQSQPQVGYGKPPVHARFKPGRSGNPAGRPRGASGLKTDVLKMLRSPVLVNEGGRKHKISTQRAALSRVREKALKGDHRSIELLFRFATTYNAEELIAINQDLLLQEDQDILAEFNRQVKGEDRDT